MATNSRPDISPTAAALRASLGKTLRSDEPAGFIPPTNGAGHRGPFAHPTEAGREVLSHYHRDPDSGRGWWDDGESDISDVNPAYEAQIADLEAELKEARQVINDLHRENYRIRQERRMLRQAMSFGLKAVERYDFLSRYAVDLHQFDDQSFRLLYRSGSCRALAHGFTLDECVDEARKNHAGEV
jgi:hypothetical protein